MAWCEQNRVDYVFGVARNERLVTKIAPAWRKPAGVQGKWSGDLPLNFHPVTIRASTVSVTPYRAV